MTLLRLAFLLPLGLAAAWLAARWGDLPPVVASSFDLAGRPRGDMSRGAFAALMLGLGAGTGIVLALTSALLPRVPDRWINLPDKDHWLAPERRAATLARTGRALDAANLATALWIALLTVAIVEFNADGAARLAPAWNGATVGYLLALVAVLAWLYAPFGTRRRALRAGRPRR